MPVRRRWAPRDALAVCFCSVPHLPVIFAADFANLLMPQLARHRHRIGKPSNGLGAWLLLIASALALSIARKSFNFRARVLASALSVLLLAYQFALAALLLGAVSPHLDYVVAGDARASPHRPLILRWLKHRPL